MSRLYYIEQSFTFQMGSPSKWVCLCLLFVGAMELSAQSAFSEETFEGKHGKLPYRMLLPQNFDEGKKYPLVLFLHGAGERGDDNQKQLVHGSKLFLHEQHKKDFPAIVIFPQCPQEDYWSNVTVQKGPNGRHFIFKDGGEPTQAMSMVIQLVDSISSARFIDKDRMYVGGLSMGGMGTFELLARRPDLFAAAFPICGGGNPSSVHRYAGKVDLWIFHGAKDDIVYPDFSVSMALALHKVGTPPKFTLYREANHNSWDPAFAEPLLLPWLFSQTKTN